MTEQCKTKLDHHDPSVKSVHLKMTETKILVYTRDPFLHPTLIYIIKNAYRLFATLPHLKECPLQYEVSTHNGGDLIVYMHPLCTK